MRMTFLFSVVLLTLLMVIIGLEAESQQIVKQSPESDINKQVSLIPLTAEEQEVFKLKKVDSLVSYSRESDKKCVSVVYTVKKKSEDTLTALAYSTNISLSCLGKVQDFPITGVAKGE